MADEHSWKEGLPWLQKSKIGDLEKELAKTLEEKNKKSIQVEIMKQAISRQNQKIIALKTEVSNLTKELRAAKNVLARAKAQPEVVSIRTNSKK